MTTANETVLQEIQEELNRQERERLAPLALFSSEAVRRRPEERQGHRQAFAQDADRILHSKAYTRYIDKTQVFSLVDNDHITHRVLHVQMVSRIARTIGRFLGLNEDLLEAIALGHDIGHPPFGHEGERILARLCRSHGLDPFQHNLQSVQFLDRFEKKGRGWNLTLQVLDGIMCHDGEVHNPRLAPQRGKTFADLDREFQAKSREPMTPLIPMSLEGWTSSIRNGRMGMPLSTASPTSRITCCDRFEPSDRTRTNTRLASIASIRAPAQVWPAGTSRGAIQQRTPRVSRLAQIASAMVGSPMHSCQWLTGSCPASSVERVPCRSSTTSRKSRRVQANSITGRFCNAWLPWIMAPPS